MSACRAVIQVVALFRCHLIPTYEGLKPTVEILAAAALLPIRSAWPHAAEVKETRSSKLLKLQTGTHRRQALDYFDRSFRAPLLAYFGRRVKNYAEAEDLTQDVFERVLRSLEHGTILNAEALVFRIAVNLLRDRARKAHTHGIEESLPVEGIGEFADALAVDLSPERVVVGERTLEEVLSALDQLSERTRAMFYLYRFENLKVREIADLYGISVSGVEKQLEKAMLHLTRRFHRT